MALHKRSVVSKQFLGKHTSTFCVVDIVLEFHVVFVLLAAHT